MAIAPSSAVTLTGAEQAVRAGIAAAQKSGRTGGNIRFVEILHLYSFNVDVD